MIKSFENRVFEFCYYRVGMGTVYLRRPKDSVNNKNIDIRFIELPIKK